MINDAGIIKISGKWAMSDEAHTLPGQTGDFEIKLVSAEQPIGTKIETNSTTPIPPSLYGKYVGWFLMRQGASSKSMVKIDDKDLILKFIPTSPSTYNINGSGANKFGQFELIGTLDESKNVHLYKKYAPIVPKSSQEKKKKVENVNTNLGSASSDLVSPSLIDSSPRESSGRVRKPSVILKESQEALKPSPKQSPKIKTQSSSRTSTSSTVSDRTPRLSYAFKKCIELLKDMMKQHQASWFLEPVDPEKYNIPEYFNIIKHPMDFSLIKKKLESNTYETIDEFAYDMRLVFKNAITFNYQLDSLVNIAARELSNKFEDKYRSLVTHLENYNNSNSIDFVDSSNIKSPRLSSSSSATIPKKTIKRSSSETLIKTPKGSLAPPSALRTSSTSALGPRALSLPPTAIDNSSLQIIELQNMIYQMQEEIKNIKLTLKEYEIEKKLRLNQEAAQNPLTFDEKKNLVSQIHLLEPDKMEKVLEIIQQAISSDKNYDEDNGEIEIPLDSLDTLTLKKLQKFIEQNNSEMSSNKRKRSSSSVTTSTSYTSSTSISTSGHSTVTTSRVAKRARRNIKTKQGEEEEEELIQDQSDIIFDDEAEDLLFDNIDFKNNDTGLPIQNEDSIYDISDKQPNSKEANIQLHDENEEEEEEDEENLWTTAAMKAKINN